MTGFSIVLQDVDPRFFNLDKPIFEAYHAGSDQVVIKIPHQAMFI